MRRKGVLVMYTQKQAGRCLSPRREVSTKVDRHIRCGGCNGWMGGGSIRFTQGCVVVGIVIATWLSDAVAVNGQEHRGDASIWRVTANAVQVYGWVDGVRESEFVNVADVAFSRDGRVAIAEQDRGIISVFSREGDFLTSFGRPGEGPGEFGRIGDIMQTAMDHLIVLDHPRQRLSEWTFDGDLIGDQSLLSLGEARPMGSIGRFGGGDWFVREADRLVATDVGGLGQDSIRFVRIVGGSQGWANPPVVAQELLHVAGTVTTQVLVEGVPSIRSALFSPKVMNVSVDNCILVGTSDRPWLSIVASTGSRVGELRFDLPIVAASERHREEWIARTVENIKIRYDEVAPTALESIEKFGSRVGMAKRIPFANNVVVDALGYIWVQSYALPEGPGSSAWEVFTAEGESIGRLELDGRLHVVSVGVNDIVGGWTGPLGRQEIRVYGLDRSEAFSIQRYPQECNSGEIGDLPFVGR